MVMALVIGRNENIAKTLRHASINARLDPALNGGVCGANRIKAKDLPVVVLVSHLFAATTKVFRDEALDGQPLVAEPRIIQGGMRDLAKALVDVKGSIAFGPSALTGDSRIWSPAQAPRLERPYTLIVDDHLDPATERAVASLVEFILGPGRQAIAKASN